MNKLNKQAVIPAKAGISKAKKAFTLVELIVVIAIIAILAVSAGMMLTKWIGKAWDTRVVADLNTIEKAMEIQYVYNANYPIPDGAITVSWVAWEPLWKQGTLWELALSNIDELDKVPEDPTKESGWYDYSVSKDQQTYEVYGKLSDGNMISYNPYLNEVVAEAKDYYIITVGNYKWYIVGATGGAYYIYNTPSMYILTWGYEILSWVSMYVYDDKQTLSSVEKTGIEVKNVEITELVTDPTNTTVLDEMVTTFPEIEDTTQAWLAVNDSAWSTVEVEVSSTSSGTTTEEETTSTPDCPSWVNCTAVSWLWVKESDSWTYNWDNAQHQCLNLSYGWYSDWFLPSKSELNSLYNAKSTIWWFVGDYYWSSTEISSSIARFQYFTNGTQDINNKNNNYYVRCVRSAN